MDWGRRTGKGEEEKGYEGGGNVEKWEMKNNISLGFP